MLTLWCPSTGVWTLTQTSIAVSTVPEYKAETLYPATGSVPEF